jgi:hypothetical protein
MGRGKLLKTKIKEAVTEASCVAEAAKLARHKAERKIDQKETLLEYAKKRLTVMLDKVDPIELVAIGGLTFIIHGVVIQTQDLLGKINLIGAVSPIGGLLTTGNPFWAWFDVALIGSPIALIINKFIQDPKSETLVDGTNQNSPMSWLFAFVVAFLIIRMGADAVNNLGGVQGIAKLLV